MDQYDRIARLGPVYLTLFPLLVLIVAFFGSQDWWEQVIALIVAAGIPVVLADVVRRFGSVDQSAMFAKWGGPPTTQLLRHHPASSEFADSNDVLRLERHRHVWRVTGIVLPTSDEERVDHRTDHYEAAIALIRPHANQQAVVARENAHYGFWRNLYALRPFLVGVAVVGLVLVVILGVLDLSHVLEVSAAWMAVEVAICLCWLALAKLAITEDAVRHAATSYAHQLLQSLPLLPTRTAHPVSSPAMNDAGPDPETEPV